MIIRHFLGEQAEHANERTLNLTTLVEATAYPAAANPRLYLSARSTVREGHGSAGHVDPDKSRRHRGCWCSDSNRHGRGSLSARALTVDLLPQELLLHSLRCHEGVRANVIPIER